MSHKNTEGYADPTAGIAMSHMMKDYRQRQKQRFYKGNPKNLYFRATRENFSHMCIRVRVRVYM